VPEYDRSHDIELHKDLIRKVGLGDAHALSELYELLSKPVAALAYRIVGQKEEVEEVLQDVFVAIWNHASSYDPELSRPFSWIVVITRRLCWNRLRSRGRHQRKLDALESQGAGPVIPEAATDPSDQVEFIEMSEQLKSRLEGFPETQEKVIEMALYDGLTHEQIAEEMNLPLGTVKTWIRRGLSKVKKEMETNL